MAKQFIHVQGVLEIEAIQVTNQPDSEDETPDVPENEADSSCSASNADEEITSDEPQDEGELIEAGANVIENWRVEV